MRLSSADERPRWASSAASVSRAGGMVTGGGGPNIIAGLGTESPFQSRHGSVIRRRVRFLLDIDSHAAVTTARMRGETPCALTSKDGPLCPVGTSPYWKACVDRGNHACLHSASSASSPVAE